MCVTNIYTDVYPTGEEGIFRQLSLCPSSFNGRPCRNHTEYNNVPRHIKYGEPTSAQMFVPANHGLQTPPRSSDSSIRHSIGIVLGSDDGASSSGTGSFYTTSSGNHKRKSRGSKSKAMLGILNIKVESSSDRKKRKEREARKEKIVVVEEAGSSSYARPIPGNIQFSPSIGVPYTPGPTRQQPPIVRHMPDTPPVVHDAFPNTTSYPLRYPYTQPTVTRDAFPQPPEMRNVSPPRDRSVSPVRIPEPERRPYGPTQPPLIIQQQRPPPTHRDRDPSPPAVRVRAPKLPPNPPAPPAEIPLPRSRSRSQSRVRPVIRATTPPPPSSRLRERSRDSRRGRSPDPSSSHRTSTGGARREDSNVRRHNAEILNRPARYARSPRPPPVRDSSFEFERERRPYAAPPANVIESSRRLNDMMGGLTTRNVGRGGAAPPVVTGSGPVVDSEMLERLRERQIPLRRRETVSGPQVMSGVERRRDRAQMRWE